jgi:hypothetical protein
MCAKKAKLALVPAAPQARDFLDTETKGHKTHFCVLSILWPVWLRLVRVMPLAI